MTERPFNILYLSSFGSISGGGQKSLYYLAVNLDKNTYCPVVAVPDHGSLADRLQLQNIRTTLLAFPRIINLPLHRNVAAIYNLFQLCNTFEIDLIHTDGPRNTFYAGVVARMKGLPLVWHVRAHNRDKYDRLLAFLSSKIILVASALKPRFQWMNKSPKLTTIYNGVDLLEFQGEKSSPKIRQQFGVEKRSLLIFFTGRIEELKGQKYLINACAIIKEKLGDFYLLLAGEIKDPIYYNECKALADNMGIGHRTIFTGHVDNVSQIMNETDIFVMPSLFEAFPRSLIEAMAVGKPVVATDVGGCSEAVEDNETGFIVPPMNPQLLAERISCLAKDEKLREKLGCAARTRVEKRFSIEENVKRTERLYREILRGYNGAS